MAGVALSREVRPHISPLLKRGDRATHPVRDFEVVILGYQRLRWTPEAVQQKREELGIENLAASAKARWGTEEVALLGQLPDEEVVRRLGRSLGSVVQKRFKLAILRTT